MRRTLLRWSQLGVEKLIAFFCHLLANSDGGYQRLFAPYLCFLEVDEAVDVLTSSRCEADLCISFAIGVLEATVRAPSRNAKICNDRLVGYVDMLVVFWCCELLVVGDECFRFGGVDDSSVGLFRQRLCKPVGHELLLFLFWGMLSEKNNSTKKFKSQSMRLCAKIAAL